MRGGGLRCGLDRQPAGVGEPRDGCLGRCRHLGRRDSRACPGRLDATGLCALWADSRSAQAPDGFHAAMAHGVNRGLLVGTDPVGVFPVYYGSAGSAVLVGSSPELFTRHSLFREEFDPISPVSVLLTMHLVGGETLVQGVRRLAAGHLLSWNQGGGPGSVMRSQECDPSERRRR